MPPWMGTVRVAALRIPLAAPCVAVGDCMAAPLPQRSVTRVCMIRLVFNVHSNNPPNFDTSVLVFFSLWFTELCFLSRFFKRCQNKIQTNQPEKILFFTLAFLQRRKKLHGKNILPLMLTLSLEAEHGYASVLPFDSDYSRKKTKAGTMARKSQNNR